MLLGAALRYGLGRIAISGLRPASFGWGYIAALLLVLTFAALASFAFVDGDEETHFLGIANERRAEAGPSST